MGERCKYCGQAVSSVDYPLTVGKLTFRDEFTPIWNGERVYLSPTELKIALLMVRAPRNIFTWSTLADTFGWGRSNDPNATARVWMSRLRAKFLRADDRFDKIASVYGAGWRWHG